MKKRLGLALSIAMFFGIAMPVFAESAPVFDADTMQQEDDLPMPPPPGQEGMEMSGMPSSPPSAAPVQAQPSMSSSERIRRLEQQIANLQENGSPSRVESLQKEVQTLRGQVEQLTHQLEQVQTQQKTMYTDLDNRVTKNTENAGNVESLGTIGPVTAKSPKAIKSAAKPAPEVTFTEAPSNPSPVIAPTVSASNDAQPNVAEEQQIYQTAYNLIKAKKYNDAIDALQSMLQKYPSGQFASNAHYWLGELYGIIGKNDLALSEFGTVVKTYSNSPRVSDAQLKIGLIYASQVKWSDAKTAFKKVINRYPGTASAKLAAAQLKQIKDAGH